MQVENNLIWLFRRWRCGSETLLHVAPELSVDHPFRGELSRAIFQSIGRLKEASKTPFLDSEADWGDNAVPGCRQNAT